MTIKSHIVDPYTRRSVLKMKRIKIIWKRKKKTAKPPACVGFDVRAAAGLFRQEQNIGRKKDIPIDNVP